MLSCLIRHRLRNNTNRTLYLREVSHKLGTYIRETRLDPGITIDNFPAAKYNDRPGSSMIVILVDKYQTFGGLSPKYLIKYFELIFDIDEDSYTLIVSGIQAQSTDYFPFRYISSLKTLPCQQRPSYFWKCITKKREFGSDYNSRPKEIIQISGFKVVPATNKGNLFPDQEMMTINVMINYDGERKKNKEGGVIWSSGAHTKWRAVLVDVNNLTVDGVVAQIRATLGIQSRLKLCHLPENYAPHSSYIHDSRILKTYLTYSPCFYATYPQLHVKCKTDNHQQTC